MGMLLLGAPPSHNGGLAQINFGLTDLYRDFWAINAIKQMSAWVAQSSTSTDWPSLINDDGYPTAIPAGVGAKWVSSQLYIHGTAGDVWVLDWTGTATLGITTTTFTGGGLSESVVNSNRKEYTITGSPSGTLADGTVIYSLLVSLQITAITSLSNLRLYRSVDETLINGSGATSIFRPDFLNRVRQFGVFRFMDWNKTNSTVNYLWADRSQEKDCIWTPANLLKGSWWYGTATQSLNKYTTANSFGSLSHGKKIQFSMPARPSTLTVLSVTNGNPSTIQFTAAHNLTTGDKITIDLDQNGGGSWSTLATAKSSSTGLPNTYTVTVTASDTITIPVNSTGFAAPSSFRFHPVVQISDGSTTKQCYRMSLSNFFNSEWAGTYPRPATAVYDATYDCFICDGNSLNHQMGIPYTAAITLCNYSRAHPFFTMQFMANDDFWTQLATLVDTTLSSGLIPRYECGNEIGWNTGPSFLQSGYATSEGLRRFATGFNDAYGARAAEVSDLIKAVHGSGTDWLMVMGVQGVGSGSFTSRFQSTASFNGGNSANYPINKCDVVAFGPYIYPPFCFASNAASYTGYVDAIDTYINLADATTAFNWMLTELTTPTNGAFGNVDQALDGWINVWTAGWTTAISGYSGRHGLSLTHYEGNDGVVGPNSIDGGFPAVATSGRTITVANVQTFWAGFLASSQHATLITNYLERSSNAGVNYPSIYTITNIHNLSENWGLQKSNDPAASASLAYTAALNWNNGL